MDIIILFDIIFLNHLVHFIYTTLNGVCGKSIDIYNIGSMLCVYREYNTFYEYIYHLCCNRFVFCSKRVEAC